MMFNMAEAVVATDNQTSPNHHHETKIHGDQKQTITVKANKKKAKLVIVLNKTNSSKCRRVNTNRFSNVFV
jgi:hypothetical protein